MAASTGMSANPMMPNFDNLTEKWTKVEYVRMYMNEEDFSKNAKGALLIKP
jgi:acyl-homoserine lactone acylase PvdQ